MGANQRGAGAPLRVAEILPMEPDLVKTSEGSFQLDLILIKPVHFFGCAGVSFPVSQEGERSFYFADC